MSHENGGWMNADQRDSVGETPGLDGTPANSEIGPEIYMGTERGSVKVSDLTDFERQVLELLGELPPRETAEQATIRVLKAELDHISGICLKASTELKGYADAWSEELSIQGQAARALLARLEMPV